MIKVFVFITGVLFLGFLFVPRILRYMEKLPNGEMMVIVVLGLCFGVSLLAAKAGCSIALGAFLMGAVIAETKQANLVVQKMEPIKDMFTAIFFVSIGMLIEPSMIIQYAVPILIITAITIVGKIFSCSSVTLLTGYDSQTSLKVGLGLAQIGEFSFIIAQLGLDSNVTSSFLYPIAVSVSVITTITTPFLMNNSNFLIRIIKYFTPKPILTFTDFYPSWIARIHETDISDKKKTVIYKYVWHHLPKFIFYTLSLGVPYFLGSRYQSHFTNINHDLYWGIITVLSFPFLIGFIYTLDKILWEGIFLNLVKSKSEVRRSKDAENLLHNTVRFSASLISGLIFLFVTSLIVPTVPLAIFIIAVIAVSGSFFWKSTHQIHKNIEKTILSVFDQGKLPNEAHAKKTHEQLLNLIRTDYPLSFETQDFLLPFHECGVNKTVKELDLRAKTGASIVGIYRGEETIANPSAEIKLLPGDVLLLIGKTDQIKAAMQYLQQKMKEAS